MSEAWNDIARQFLEKRGFSCEAEPDWIMRGEKKPDFFCSGPLDLWVEVKSLSEEEEDKHVKQISDYFRTQANEVSGQGSGMAYVAAKATTRDAKIALKLANDALSRPEAHSRAAVWIVIPAEPDYGRRISFSVSTRKGPIWLVSCKAKDERYGYPFYLKPDPWDQIVEVVSDDGPTYSKNLDSLADQKRYRLAVQIHPDPKAFHITACFPSGPAKRLTNVKRIRKDIGNSRSKLKNGIRYREAPGVVFVFQEGIFVPDDQVIFSALFGDLTFVFPPGDLSAGHPAFGRNSVWGPKQSRTISALTYFRCFASGGLPCTIHNPHALRPVPHGIFGGREWIPESGGDPITFHLVEHPT